MPRQSLFRQGPLPPDAKTTVTGRATGTRDQEIKGWQVELPIPDSGGWFALANFLLTDNGLVLGEVRIFPGSIPENYGAPLGAWSMDPTELAELPEGGVTQRLLRKVPIGELISHAVKQAEDFRRQMERNSAEPPRWIAQLAAADVSRPGRAGRPDSYYAAWARLYLDKCSDKSTARAPIAALARDHGLSAGQVRDLVHKARARELLTKGAPGSPGGMLTKKGQAALQRPGGAPQ